MEFDPLEVEGAVLVRSERRGDERGWFARIFCAQEFAEAGLVPVVEQINLALTSGAGTVRGLHYQLPPAAEAKLVRCVQGSIFDVVVDTRKRSPTFGRWRGVELTADDGAALYVPPGCAHGYQSLTNEVRTLYHASAAFTPAAERGIHHADPQLAIYWPLPPANVSAKDRALPFFSRAELLDN